MKTPAFSRRIYTWPEFKAAVNDLFQHLEDLRSAARGGRIGKDFAQKIMLAVSQVNNCRYCLYGHSRAALAAGVDPVEIRELLAGDLGSFPEQEAVALAYAQHYAECQCQPDPAAGQRLAATYGVEAARDIHAYLRMITFGNLFGNTFDALLSRLGGNPAQRSSLWNELGVVFGALALIPWKMLSYQVKRPISRPEIRLSQPPGRLSDHSKE